MMGETFGEWQRSALEQLLDQYENSKTYQGTNQVSQTFSIQPSRVFAKYDSDFASIDLIHDFERQMEELERAELLTIKRQGRVMEKLVANPEKWACYYKALGRKGKKLLVQEQIELYQEYLGSHAMLNCFCKEQIGRLEEGKKAEFPAEEARRILKLWKFLLENREEILERELSIAVLGDSKIWEKHYRAKICRLLKKYGDFEDLLQGVDDEKEVSKILLEEYRVVPNPSYVYLKGDAELTFTDGQKLRTGLGLPVAFTEKTFNNIKKITIFASRVMTVENVTSFNRLEEGDFFYLFLSGYHNRFKQRLLSGIYKDNKKKEWFHFGDIDPDGFYIIEHLKRGTGIPFQPLHMGADILGKYDSYTKPLNDNDIRKAKTLLQQGKYSEVMEYMLREQRKLEQEIVSWMEKKF